MTKQDTGIDFCLIVSASGHIRFASSAFARVLGISPELLAGAPVAELIDERNARSTLDEHGSCRARNRPWQGDLCFRRPDGTTVWANVSVAPSPEKDGEQGTYWYAVCIDQPAQAATSSFRGISSRISLKHLLTGFSVLLVAGLVALGFATLSGNASLGTMVREESRLYSESINAARSTQVHFKKQVQEWKNVLLRGHVQADFDKYWGKFVREEEIVAEHLDRLSEILIRLNLDPAEAQEIKAELAQLGVAYREAIELFDPGADAPQRVVDAAVRGIDRAPTDALDALTDKILSAAAEHIGTNVDSSVDDARRTAIIGSSHLTILLILAFLAGSRFLFRNLETLRGAVLNLSLGKYLEPIDFGRRNEFGSIARGLKTLQVTLALEQLRMAESAAQGHELRLALNNADAALMMLDADHRITFVNKAMSKLLEDNAADFRNANAAFDTKVLLGMPIERCWGDDAGLQDYLDSLACSSKRDLELGGRHFELKADPILNDSAHRTGTLITWHDATLEKRISHGVRSLVMSAKDGDLAGRVDVREGGEFLNQLGADINDLVSVAESAIDDAVHVLGSIASGDLSQQVVRDYQGSFGQLKENANATGAKLTELISGFKSDADMIRGSSIDIDKDNEDLATRTQRQSASLEQIIASMQELTSTIEQNSENATHAENLTVSASTKAEEGCVVVTRAVGAMDQIIDSSETISQIVGVIDEIAFQTNLLALNAAVEAARAGDQGKGFAVVAGEVRTLAQRSATAAKEIKQLVDDSVEKVSVGTDLVSETGEALADIVMSVREVAAIVGEISGATTQQTSGIQEVGIAISEMDEMTQKNADLVIHLTTASRRLRERASAIHDSLGFFDVSQEQVADPEQMQAANSEF